MSQDGEQLSADQLYKQLSDWMGTPLGQKVMSVIRAQQEGYTKLAAAFETPQDQVIKANERAAGIGEVISFFDNAAILAEHPEYFEANTQKLDN